MNDETFVLRWQTESIEGFLLSRKGSFIESHPLRQLSELEQILWPRVSGTKPRSEAKEIHQSDAMAEMVALTEQAEEKLCKTESLGPVFYVPRSRRSTPTTPDTDLQTKEKKEAGRKIGQECQTDDIVQR